MLFAWFIFLISEVFAFSILYNLYMFDYDIWDKEEITKSDWHDHTLIMAGSMVVANGHGMLIFRLIPTCRTRCVKYLHAFIHTIIIGGTLIGYNIINKFMTENAHDKFSFDHLHTYLALMAIGAYLIQWTGGVFVYLYLYSTQRRRKLFASTHNFMGICVLQIAIAAACVQIQQLDYDINLEEYHSEYAMISMVVYGVLINSIVLNPYLEWRLVRCRNERSGKEKDKSETIALTRRRWLEREK